MTQTKTMAIKARMANIIRAMLYKKTNFSDSEKLAMFNEIYSLNSEVHTELNDYKAKRKTKRAVQVEREKRGWKPKKKTSLEEYKKNLVSTE